MGKKLLLIPFVILLISIAGLFYMQATTGDFVSKGISLKGGTSLTILNDADVSINYGGELNIRTLSSAGKKVGTIVEIDTIDDSKVNRRFSQFFHYNR